MQEQEIFDHIETGRHQELYHEWATSGTWSVRYKLARKGYELDTLVHDKNEVIRDTAMMQYPEKVPAYLNSEPDMEQMYRNMLNLTYIDHRVLEYQIDYWTNQKGYDSDIGHSIVSTLKTKKSGSRRGAVINPNNHDTYRIVQDGQSSVGERPSCAGS